MLQSPTVRSIDGIQLDRFERDHLYDVGELLGALLITEGWARLAASNGPAPLLPLRDGANTTPVADVRDRTRRPLGRKKR